MTHRHLVRGLFWIGAFAAVGGILACKSHEAEGHLPNGAPSVASPSAPAPRAMSSVPAPDEPRVARARAAMQALQARLGARLKEVMAANGPAAAVTVCADEAPAIAREISAEQGVRVGRSSGRLRSPANAPAPWLADWLAAAESNAAPPEGAVFDLGSALGVVEPIVIAPLCLTCHGDAPPEDVRSVLRQRYPSDRATGYQAGSLRGALWAEIDR